MAWRSVSYAAFLFDDGEEVGAVGGEAEEAVADGEVRAVLRFRPQEIGDRSPRVVVAQARVVG